MIAFTPRARLALLLLVAASMSSTARAQGDTARFDPVVVTATHEPMSRGALPVAVTVITGDELRRRGITTVAEALTDVTSAYVARAGSPGATTSLFLRGGESRYVKVLIDGVPVNDPGGTYDFASLSTDNVERIEVVRGPASVVHGADAATGVVHVITRRGEGPPRVDVRVAAGTMPRDGRVHTAGAGAMTTSDVTAAMSGALTGGSYSVAVARHEADGLYQLNNDYRNNVLSARFQLAPGDATTLRFNLRYHDYRFHYPTNSGGDAAPGDANAYRSEDRTAIGAEVERRIGAARVVLALNSSGNDGGTDDQPADLALFSAGSTISAEWAPRELCCRSTQASTMGARTTRPTAPATTSSSRRTRRAGGAGSFARISSPGPAPRLPRASSSSSRTGPPSISRTDPSVRSRSGSPPIDATARDTPSWCSRRTRA